MTRLVEYRGHIRNWKTLCAELGIDKGLEAKAREEAIRMRDAGNIVGAQYMLYGAVDDVKMYCPAMAEDLGEEAKEVKDDSKWNTSRKKMRARANKIRTQQKGDSVR